MLAVGYINFAVLSFSLPQDNCSLKKITISNRVCTMVLLGNKPRVSNIQSMGWIWPVKSYELARPTLCASPSPSLNLSPPYTPHVVHGLDLVLCALYTAQGVTLGYALHVACHWTVLVPWLWSWSGSGHIRASAAGCHMQYAPHTEPLCCMQGT